MERALGKICAEGFSFFGVTNRLISHELKNILAIISETAGLFEELVELSESGMRLEPGKLRSLGESIEEEIGRANAVVGVMNQFAHSVDDFFSEVDVDRTLDLMVSLSHLNPLSKTVKIQHVRNETQIVYTSPFFLQNLIHQALDFALAFPGPNREIHLGAHPGGDKGVRICFSGIASDPEGAFPAEGTEILAKAISVDLSLDPLAGELHLTVPQRTGSGPIDRLLLKT
jgi:hypothetical protein